MSVWPGKTTPCSFAKATSWDRPIEAVTMTEPESRFVHAKWYEFKFADQRALLTLRSPKDTGLTRQTVYRIKDDLVRAEAALSAWGLLYLP